MHWPVAGPAGHSERLSGRVALPVSAEATMLPCAPTLAVATAKAAAPVVPGTCTMPSFVEVAASTTTSGTGVEEAVNASVFTPAMIGAGGLFAHAKANCTSGGATGEVGVMAKTKLWAAPAGIFAAVLGDPVV